MPTTLDQSTNASDWNCRRTGTRVLFGSNLGSVGKRVLPNFMDSAHVINCSLKVSPFSEIPWNTRWDFQAPMGRCHHFCGPGLDQSMLIQLSTVYQNARGTRRGGRSEEVSKIGNDIMKGKGRKPIESVGELKEMRWSLQRRKVAMYEWIKERKRERKKERKKERKEGRQQMKRNEMKWNERRNEWMDGWMIGWMEEGRKEGMVEWMNGWMEERTIG